MINRFEKEAKEAASKTNVSTLRHSLALYHIANANHQLRYGVPLKKTFMDYVNEARKKIRNKKISGE